MVKMVLFDKKRLKKGLIQGHFGSKRVILGQTGSSWVQKGHFGSFQVIKGHFQSKMPLKVISVFGRKKNFAEKFLRFKMYAEKLVFPHLQFSQIPIMTHPEPP